MDMNILDDILDGVGDTISFARSHRRDPIAHRRWRHRRPRRIHRAVLLTVTGAVIMGAVILGGVTSVAR